MKELYFATKNPAKIDQLNFLIKHLRLPIKVYSTKEKFNFDDFSEEGLTTPEIALTKAKDAAQKINYPAIAEHWGLAIDSLSGKPGPQSGTFLTKQGRKALLDLMKGSLHRQAHLTSAVAIATPEGIYKLFIHRLPGTISFEERWSRQPHWIAPHKHPHGGAFNALFIPNGKNKTLAEMTPEEILTISHRDQSFKQLLEYIQENPSIFDSDHLIDLEI